MLELSGAVRASENPLKNICENANRHVHGGVHLVVVRITGVSDPRGGGGE